MLQPPNLWPTCPYCGSDDASKDATVRWNVVVQDWAITGVFDDSHCESCDSELERMEEVEISAEAIGSGTMMFGDAMQIVVELARQNVASQSEMPEEHARQIEACNEVEDFITN